MKNIGYTIWKSNVLFIPTFWIVISLRESSMQARTSSMTLFLQKGEIRFLLYFKLGATEFGKSFEKLS